MRTIGLIGGMSWAQRIRQQGIQTVGLLGTRYTMEEGLTDRWRASEVAADQGGWYFLYAGSPLKSSPGSGSSGGKHPARVTRAFFRKSGSPGTGGSEVT